MNWFYATKNEQQIGPVDDTAIPALIKEGTITPATLVWSDGMPDWELASKTALAGHFPKNPPPKIPKVADLSHPTPNINLAPSKNENIGDSFQRILVTIWNLVCGIVLSIYSAAKRNEVTGDNGQWLPVAILSLACGIFSPICFLFTSLAELYSLRFISVLAGISAVILGYVAIRKIRNNPGVFKGGRHALAGIILGLVLIVFVWVVLPIARHVQKHDPNSGYFTDHPTYGQYTDAQLIREISFAYSVLGHRATQEEYNNIHYKWNRKQLMDYLDELDRLKREKISGL